MASTAAILALILLLLPPIALAAGDLNGFRATLTRIHQLSPGKHSEAVRRDGHRLAFLSYAATAAAGKATTTGTNSSSVNVQAQLENGAGAYNMNISLGTPPLDFPMLPSTHAGASPRRPVHAVEGSVVQSTPLLKNPYLQRSTLYYVNLTGIAVDSTELPVTGSTFGFTQTGLGGGTIVDSGTTLTYLAKDGYAMVKQAFQSQMANLNQTTPASGAPYDLDLCYKPSAGGGGKAVRVPRLALRFAGGAKYNVPVQNYFAGVEADSQGRVTVACLLVLPATDDLPISIIGNLMQMDMHLLYDIDGGMFSFAPADCAKL
uniref:Peptidase A1 domain-containing protein n=1 Tax=Oryza meridionalis TaxID=40149 RepID=A0A0E0ECF7_9ORYZ